MSPQFGNEGASQSGGGSSSGSSLPAEIVESIAISNAKSIGEQPAILANMALANQILNNNLQQQIAISQQQAMSQISMAALSKCISIITNDGGSSVKADEIESLLKSIFNAGGTQPTPAPAPSNPPQS